MKKDKIHLSSPHISGHEKKYLETVFDVNSVSSFSSNILDFEDDLENYLGEGSKAVVLSSGTAAIHLALVLSEVKQDDIVLCQSFTFCASSNPIVYQKATPVFIGSEIGTWNMCPMQLEIAIVNLIAVNKKPKAIIVVHLYGMPAKIDEIQIIASKYGICLIEDAAEALGSTFKGDKCGTIGDFGILSFNSNKIITTFGGGALICKNQEDKSKAVFLATQARDKAIHYEHSNIGYNYRMSNIAAGIGRGQMEVLDKYISLRQETNRFYKKIFKGIAGVTVFTEQSDSYVSNHWLSCVLIDEKIAGFSREKLRLDLSNADIESRPLWKPMHLQPIYSNSKFFGNEFSEELFNTGLCLPSGSNLSNEDKERIKRVLNNIV